MLARVERFEVKESRANSRLHHDCDRSALAIVVRTALTTGIWVVTVRAHPSVQQ